MYATNVTYIAFLVRRSLRWAPHKRMAGHKITVRYNISDRMRNIDRRISASARYPRASVSRGTPPAGCNRQEWPFCGECMRQCISGRDGPVNTSFALRSPYHRLRIISYAFFSDMSRLQYHFLLTYQPGFGILSMGGLIQRAGGKSVSRARSKRCSMLRISRSRD